MVPRGIDIDDLLLNSKVYMTNKEYTDAVNSDWGLNPDFAQAKHVLLRGVSNHAREITYKSDYSP